jgi:CheY-like chemotaxis protein
VAAGQVPGGSERVLVVEDDPAVREIARELLEAVGYRVQVAPDGQEALALCARAGEPPQLLLTDVVLPGVTGPQLAENLTAAYAGLRVLFISGYAADALGRATTLPADVDLLVKPFTRDALLRRVRAALDR